MVIPASRSRHVSRAAALGSLDILLVYYRGLMMPLHGVDFRQRATGKIEGTSLAGGTTHIGNFLSRLARAVASAVARGWCLCDAMGGPTSLSVKGGRARPLQVPVSCSSVMTTSPSRVSARLRVLPAVRGSGSIRAAAQLRIAAPAAAYAAVGREAGG